MDLLTLGVEPNRRGKYDVEEGNRKKGRKGERRGKTVPLFMALHLCRAVLAMSEMSVKGVNCDKTKETSTHIFIPYARAIILVFQQEK